MLAELICASAFAFELSRALSGNALSWAYVFEWPILGAYAIYVWRKLLHDEDPGHFTQPTESSAEEVQRLHDYNDYLSRVHRDNDQDSRPSADSGC